MATEQTDQAGGRRRSRSDERPRRASASRTSAPAQTYELPITDGTIRAPELRQIKVARRRLRADVLRPGVPEHRLLPQRDHLDRRRQGRALVPRHPDRAALRAEHLPRGRLPADLRRAADQGPARRSGCTTSRIHTFVHENIKKFVEGFRYDAHPMGMLLATVGALSTFYPDAKHINDPDERYMATIRLIAKMPTLAAFAYRHNLGLPVRLSRQRPRLPRQLPLDDVQDDRAQVRARPAPRASPRRAVHPARRPRAELLDERRARRRLARRSIPTRRSRRGVAALYGPLHGGANEEVLKMLDARSERSRTSRTSWRA